MSFRLRFLSHTLLGSTLTLVALAGCAPETRINQTVTVNTPSEPDAPKIPGSTAPTPPADPDSIFRALGGVGLDPTVARTCRGESVEGNQGYTLQVAREYRGYLEQLSNQRVTPVPAYGGLYGIDNFPLGLPTPPPNQPVPTALPSAQDDISIVERTIFNGKVFDDTRAELDGVRIVARSLNSSVPYEAETITVNGTYAFNNAPSGVQIEIIASRPGYTTRRRVEVLKSNKQGDPDANRYDFGVGESTTPIVSPGTGSNPPTPVPTAIPTPAPTPLPTAIPTNEPLPPPVKARDSFFFSYDDSASVASVELFKNKMRQNQPFTGQARAWEFLNYETFDRIGQQSTGQFNISLGLWKYPDPRNPLRETYEVGAHVTAPYVCKESRQPLNLTVLIDVSTSMTEAANRAIQETDTEAPTKLELVKFGLRQMASQLKPGDLIHIIQFSNRPFPEAQAFEVGVDDEAEFLDQIAKIEPLGGTNLQAAIDEGYRQAERYFDSERINRLLFMTDAQPTEGNLSLTRIENQARQANDRQIYLSALGLGETHNQRLLNAMSEAGKGAYYSINTRTDMKEAMGDRFIPLMQVAARNMRFKLEFPGFMRHGETAAEEVSRDASEVLPTNFSSNSSQYFWEQFQGNRGEFDGRQTLKLTLQYEDPLSGERRQETLEKSLSDILDQDLQNIKTAHLIHAVTRRANGEISADEASFELTTVLPDIGK